VVGGEEGGRVGHSWIAVGWLRVHAGHAGHDRLEVCLGVGGLDGILFRF
jgi:hypothetical protein